MNNKGANVATNSDDESPKPTAAEMNAALVKLLPNQFGMRVTLGERSKEVLYEGPHLKIPFLQVIEAWSMDFGPDHEFVAHFISKDKLPINVSGSIQWRADPTIRVRSGHREGHVVFPTMKTAVIKKGIDDKVANIIAGIGGHYDGEAFIGMRAELADLINSTLRLSKPLHMKHVQGDEDCCGLGTFCGCTEQVIEPSKQLDFYKAHMKRVKEMLAKDPLDFRDNSETELLYGIDIGTLELAEVDFDEETKKAMAEAKQSELRQKPFNDVLDGIRELKLEGFGAEAAGSLAASLKIGTDDFPHSTNVVQVSGLVEVASILGDKIAAALNKK